MKTIIISDLHLDTRFEQKKFDYLRILFEDADRIVLNGDFWDGDMCFFNDFLKSRWRELFPILKIKGSVCIYGNHDHKMHSDERVLEYSDYQAKNYELAVGDKILHIEHGDKIMWPPEDPTVPYPTRHFWAVLTHGLHRAMTSILGRSFFRLYFFTNNMAKKWAKRNLSANTILVCGHSHYAEFDTKNQYINTGFVQFGYASYLKIEDDQMELIKERY